MVLTRARKKELLGLYFDELTALIGQGCMSQSQINGHFLDFVQVLINLNVAFSQDRTAVPLSQLLRQVRQCQLQGLREFPYDAIYRKFQDINRIQEDVEVARILYGDNAAQAPGKGRHARI
ncbi:MAG: hypothetical protein ACHQJ6_06625 [Candidatus Berkiellales bacterium]